MIQTSDSEEADMPSDDLDERLAGALERLGHVTRTMLARSTYAESVSPLQYQLLVRLRSASAGPRVSDLAVELDVSQATISEALSAMRRKGLVHRRQDLVDRRSSVLSLTAEGEALCDRLDQWDGPLRQNLSGIGEHEKAVALRVMLQLIADFQRDGIINVARTCLTCRYLSETESGERYHCTLLDVNLGDAQLRVDCSEHELAV